MSKEEMHICIADKKGINEMKLIEYVSPEVNSENNLFFKDKSLNEERFKMWSLYPFITRDIAVWVPNNVDSQLLLNICKEFGGELLVTEPKLFDKFIKGDRTSYAYRLVFQSYDKTLTDEEINKIIYDNYN
jgi:phenylalanyl-tRNA synthetase beta subunit